MVYINEWLPNPAGADSGAEWVELFNSGSEKISLQNWSLVTGSGKKFVFKAQNINAGGYLVLKQPETKLILRNKDELLSLYGVNGKLADQSSFYGSAPEGKSYSRAGGAENKETIFIFSEPTPGAANKIVKEISAAENYPVGQLLGQSFGLFDALGLALFVGLVYPVFIIAIFKKNDYLSKLFFGRD